MKKYSHLNFLLLSLPLLFFSSINCNAQVQITDTSYKYFKGTEQPSEDWKLRAFDDTGWSSGTYSIGWGDNDDYTLIDTVPSCYLRYKFDIADLASIQDLIFFADFDDAFVAYLNGIEFARVNIGKFNTPVNYDQLADRSHETEFYRNTQFPVLGYYVDDTIVQKHLNSTNNVLAIEVHNDSIRGSDLSMYCFLINTQGHYNIFDFISRYKRSVELDSTILPIVIIESDEFGILADGEGNTEIPKVTAKMGIIDNGTGKYNHPTDNFNNYSGLVEIEVRGQSSASFPKRPYNFELRDPNGNDTSVSLLGLPKESDWILQGPFADKSQIRNALIYELGRKTGHWTPRTAFCEVILNGEFVGLYNLIEDIKRDSFRIDIANLKPDEISGNDVTGGYILKYDKPNGTLQIAYPKSKDLQPEQEDYIRQFITDYTNVLKTNDGLDSTKGYKKYIDYYSLIDYIIISELGKNCDSYLNSSYFYKDRDDRNNKLVYGPLWDFDLCFGNAFWQQGDVLEGWEFAVNSRFNITRLFQDTSLVHLFQKRWKECRKSFLSDDSLMAKIDSLTNWLGEPINRNYQVWPVIDKGLFFPAYEVHTYNEELNFIKDWISTRTAWIDANIDSIYYPVTHYSSVDDEPFADNNIVDKVFPNPFSDEINISMNLKSESVVQVNLVSIDGRSHEIISPVKTESGNYIIHWVSNDSYAPGLYIVNVIVDGKSVCQEKVLKVN
jgi:hypothetical protein